MKEKTTVRKRILDLFKNIFKGIRNRLTSRRNPKVTETVRKHESQMFQYRKKPPSRWLISHNQFQAQQANKIRKRRKANKVARKHRQINRHV